MSSPEPSYGTKKINISKNSKYFHSVFLRILKMFQSVSVLHKLIPWMNGESFILRKYKLTGGFDPKSPFLASDRKVPAHEF